MKTLNLAVLLVLGSVLVSACSNTEEKQKQEESLVKQAQEEEIAE